MKLLTHYFLRDYAAQLDDRTVHGVEQAFANAKLDAMWLVVLFLGSLQTTVGVVVSLPPGLPQKLMTHYEDLYVLAVVAATFAASWIYVSAKFGQYRQNPEAAAPFRTQRDHGIAELHFYTAALGLVALPFITFLVMEYLIL